MDSNYSGKYKNNNYNTLKRNAILTETMNGFLDKMKKASKGVVDAGAKTMLKTDILFLDREIQNRKKTFGIEIYDLMAELELDTTQDAAAKEAKIRAVFDAARKDIAVFQAKKDCKNEEMAVLDAESSALQPPPPTNSIPPSSGTVLTNTHPSETEQI